MILAWKIIIMMIVNYDVDHPRRFIEWPVIVAYPIKDVLHIQKQKKNKKNKRGKEKYGCGWGGKRTFDCVKLDSY